MFALFNHSRIFRIIPCSFWENHHPKLESRSWYMLWTFVRTYKRFSWNYKKKWKNTLYKNIHCRYGQRSIASQQLWKITQGSCIKGELQMTTHVYLQVCYCLTTYLTGWLPFVLWIYHFCSHKYNYAGKRQITHNTSTNNQRKHSSMVMDNIYYLRH